MEKPGLPTVFLRSFYGVIFTCKNVFSMAFLHVKKPGTAIAEALFYEPVISKNGSLD